MGCNYPDYSDSSAKAIYGKDKFNSNHPWDNELNHIFNNPPISSIQLLAVFCQYMGENHPWLNSPPPPPTPTHPAKMATILQTIFLDACSQIKILNCDNEFTEVFS